MDCLSSLPDLVLDKVICEFYTLHVVSEPRQHLKIHNARLIPLLSTCRRVRQATLPYLYRIVRCSLQRYGAGVDRAATWSAHSLDRIPSEQRRQIEHLVIDASTCVVDSVVLQRFLTDQQISSISFPAIRSMVIRQYLERNRSWLISRSQDLTTTLSDYIIENFSSIERLEYMATSTDTISDMHPIYSLVPRMPLLRTLVSTATIPPELADIDQPLSTLYVCKSIPISTANRPWVVSQAISQSLTSLTMKNFSLRDILFLFRQSSVDTTMSAFPNLRLLDLELSVLLHGDGNTDDFDQEHFELPSLTYLRLASDADLCVSFQRRIRYPQLLDLVIELSQRDTTVDFYLCGTPALRLLRVIGDTSRDIPEDPRCCDVDLRPLLTMCYNLHMLDLRVRRIPLPCLRSINSSEGHIFVLQRLEIHFPIATEQFVKLMLCLPLLIHLSVAWCEHPRYPEFALDSPTIFPSLEIISVPSIFGVLEDVPFRRFAELTRHMPVLQTIRAPAMIANMIELAIWRSRRGMKDGALDMPQFIFVDSGAIPDS